VALELTGERGAAHVGELQKLLHPHGWR
jgi:hypothetical protein